MAERDIIKDIYKKTANGTGSLTKIGTIGADGENISLNTVQPTAGKISDASGALNSSNAIYYNNVQAQMVRKGIQINNLNSTVKDLKTDLYGTEGSSTTPASDSVKGQIQSLASSFNNYVPISTVDGATYNEEIGKYTLPDSEIMTKASTVSVRRVRNIGNLDTISVPDTNLPGGLAIWLNVTTQEAQKLHTILPYLAAVNPILEHPSSSGSAGTFEGWDINPSTMAGSVGTRGGATEEQVTAYNTALRSVVERNDGLLNIAKKYNSLYTYVQNNSNNLIQRYYTQKEHYKVYDSNVKAVRGLPTTSMNDTTMVLNWDGHMRYLPYKFSEVTIGQVSTITTTFVSSKNSWGNWGVSTPIAWSNYSGDIIASAYISATTGGIPTLADVDKLPVPPSGFRWECVYARGTETVNNNNQLWEVFDGWNYFNGFLLGSKLNNSDYPCYVNFSIDAPNLLKGAQTKEIVSMYQSFDQFKSITLNSEHYSNGADYIIGNWHDGGGHYPGTLPTPSLTARKFLQHDNIPTNLYFLTASSVANEYCGSDRYERMVLFQRIKPSASGMNNDLIKSFKYNQNTKKIDVSLQYARLESTDSFTQPYFMQYFDTAPSTVCYRERPTTVIGKNFFTTLYFNEPFAYAEYVLVPDTEPIDPFKLFRRDVVNPVNQFPFAEEMKSDDNPYPPLI